MDNNNIDNIVEIRNKIESLTTGIMHEIVYTIRNGSAKEVDNIRKALGSEKFRDAEIVASLECTATALIEEAIHG